MSREKIVSVFVGGVQKSGTRSISDYFRQILGVSVQKKKEAHFFDNDDFFLGDVVNNEALNNYHSSFNNLSNESIWCDVTPDYIFRKNAVKRIYNYNPKAKWVILLRNPIERCYSAWNMEVNRKTENLSFEDALKSEINGNVGNRIHDRFQYIKRSKYSEQLKRLWKYFSESQCHVIASEQLWENPDSVLSKLVNDLNIDKGMKAQYRHVHKGIYSSEISPLAVEILNEKLKYELDILPKMLGWDKQLWRVVK